MFNSAASVNRNQASSNPVSNENQTVDQNANNSRAKRLREIEIPYTPIKVEEKLKSIINGKEQNFLSEKKPTDGNVTLSHIEKRAHQFFQQIILDVIDEKFPAERTTLYSNDNNPLAAQPDTPNLESIEIIKELRSTTGGFWSPQPKYQHHFGKDTKFFGKTLEVNKPWASLRDFINFANHNSVPSFRVQLKPNITDTITFDLIGPSKDFNEAYRELIEQSERIDYDTELKRLVSLLQSSFSVENSSYSDLALLFSKWSQTSQLSQHGSDSLKETVSIFETLSKLELCINFSETIDPKAKKPRLENPCVDTVLFCFREAFKVDTHEALCAALGELSMSPVLSFKDRDIAGQTLAYLDIMIHKERFDESVLQLSV